MMTKWLQRLVLAAGCVLMASCAGNSRGAGGGDPMMPPEQLASGATDRSGTDGRTKRWTGSVRFVGFSDQQLDEIRVIPEESSRVYRPGNTGYRGVDGFWWKPDRWHWFKIPGHCEVVVWPPGYDGETPPVGGTGEDVLIQGDRPRTWLRCKPWLTRILASRGRVSTAGWYPNAGKSAIGARYPF